MFRLCVHFVNISLVLVTPSQLSHGRPHILDIHFALQLAQTAPVMLHGVFACAMCQRTHFFYKPCRIRLFLCFLALVAGDDKVWIMRCVDDGTLRIKLVEKVDSEIIKVVKLHLDGIWRRNWNV